MKRVVSFPDPKPPSVFIYQNYVKTKIESVRMRLTTSAVAGTRLWVVEVTDQSGAVKMTLPMLTMIANQAVILTVAPGVNVLALTALGFTYQSFPIPESWVLESNDIIVIRDVVAISATDAVNQIVAVVDDDI